MKQKEKKNCFENCGRNGISMERQNLALDEDEWCDWGIF